MSCLHYWNNCVGWPYDEVEILQAIIDEAEPVDWDTFRKCVCPKDIEKIQGGLGYVWGISYSYRQVTMYSSLLPTGYNWVRRGKGKPKIVNIKQQEHDSALFWWEGNTQIIVRDVSSLFFKPVKSWKEG